VRAADALSRQHGMTNNGKTYLFMPERLCRAGQHCHFLWACFGSNCGGKKGNFSKSF
jgi:hypothetical protein